jgi:hypothetical protein
MAERDRTERGETAEDARAHVRREFGSVLLTKEVTREQWGRLGSISSSSTFGSQCGSF